MGQSADAIFLVVMQQETAAAPAYSSLSHLHSRDISNGHMIIKNLAA